MEADIAGIFATLAAMGIKPTPDILRERYAEVSGRQKVAKNTPVDLFEAFDSFVDDSKTLLQPGTIAIYKTLKKHLEGFAKAYGVRITWESVNLLFFQKFTEYLIRIEGHNNQTLDKDIQRLRAFLRHCDEVRGIPMCRDYTKFTRKALPRGEQSRKVYLTRDELQRLEAFDLSSNDRLRKVRDLFLFLAHTGLRFGDSQQLRPEHMKGDVFELTTGKNRKTIRIPVHPLAGRIWSMYEGRLPRLSNQKFNDYVKELCELVEINESCEVIDFAGAQRRERTVPKWELVGAHTAKRSFVTNLLLAGVSLETVCEITGNNRDSIQKYIVPTGDDVRRDLTKAWD